MPESIQPRDFCEEELVSWYKATDSLAGFYKDFRMASLQLLSISVRTGFDCVKVEGIQQDIPKNISDTFDHHFCYLQYSLSGLYLLKIPIAEKTCVNSADSWVS